MSVADDFFALLENTEPVREVLRSLKEEPARLLGDICVEYGRTGQPVPDHRLHLASYVREVGLKALLAAGLIKRETGGRLSLFSYEPTAEGLAQCERLKSAGFYERKQTSGEASPSKPH